MRRDVFQAIADPTRREIIEILANCPLNLNAVAEKFSISRPAISKQIRILEECGIVKIRQEGRERYCELQKNELDHVTDWINKNKKFWNDKLNELETLINDKGK